MLLKKNKRIRISNLFFFGAWTLYLIDSYFGASVIAYSIPKSIFNILLILIMILLLLKLIYTEKFSKTTLLKLIFIFFSTFFAAITGGYESLVLSVFLIMSSKNVKFKDILKYLVIWTIICSIIIISLSLLGVIPDYTYPHNSGTTIVIAHSLGFKHYITLGCICMTLTVSFLYLKRKIDLLNCVILILCNYLAFKIHTGRLTFMITCLIIVSMYIWCNYKKCNYSSPIIKKILVLFPFIIFGITLLFVGLYASGIISSNNPFWGTTESRLVSSIQAIKKYGINFWGTQIEQYGITKTYYGTAKSSFFVDSGYIFSAIGYGMLFTLVYLTMLSKLFSYLYSIRKVRLIIWFGLILIACVVNNFLLDVVNNPILFLMPLALSEMNNSKRKQII